MATIEKGQTMMMEPRDGGGDPLKKRCWGCCEEMKSKMKRVVRLCYDDGGGYSESKLTGGEGLSFLTVHLPTAAAAIDQDNSCSSKHRQQRRAGDEEKKRC